MRKKKSLCKHNGLLGLPHLLDKVNLSIRQLLELQDGGRCKYSQRAYQEWRKHMRIAIRAKVAARRIRETFKGVIDYVQEFGIDE